MPRLFVAIRPPEPIRDLLIDAMDDSADFRWQDDEQLHLTLRFVGEVDRPVAEDVASALIRVHSPAFELRIAGVGRFEQRSSGALWAGVEPKEPVAALAATFGQIHAPRMELRIAGVGRFEQRSSGALWAGVEPKAPVAALAAKVERACQSAGLEPERRAFHPHITLARWKGRRTREVQDFLTRTGGLLSEPFDVTEFILFESRLSRHGAHYEPLESYPLS